MQSSTAELITGLVQLVPLTNSTQLSQEAMEVSPPSLFMLFPRGSSSGRLNLPLERFLLHLN